MDEVKRKLSEVIAEFVNFLESADQEYKSAFADVGKEDSTVQTFLHDMEFALDGKTRNKIATSLQKSRKERRKGKDRVQLYGKVHEFLVDRQNQNLLKALRRLQNEQVTIEKICLGSGSLRTV